MKKDLVKVHQDFIKLNLGILREKELELFYYICLNVGEMKDRVIEIDFSEIRKALGNPNSRDFRNYVVNFQKKMAGLSITNFTDLSVSTITLFEKLENDLDNDIFKVQVTESSLYFFNNVKPYLRFFFSDIRKLSGKYSKLLVPYLMKESYNQEIEFDKERLFEILEVKKTYRKDLSNFNRQILKPAVEELQDLFINLKCLPQKKGRKIISYKFTWENNFKDYFKKDFQANETIKIKTTDEELKEFFIKEFPQINWHKGIEKALFKTLKNNTLQYVKNYLTRLWEKLDYQSNVKDKNALFVQYIQEKRDIPNSVPIKEPETVNPIINKLFGNEEKTEEYWDKAIPNNIYQPNIFENAKSISEIQENKNQQKEQKNEKEKIKITQEEYDKFLEEYMKKLGYTDKKIAEFFFNKVNNYEIVKNDITVVVDEIENKYNSYNKEFREFWKLDYLKDEFEKIKEHYDLDDYLEMKKDEMKYLKEQYKEFEEWKKKQIKKEEAEQRKAEKEIMKMAMGRGYEDEDFEDKKEYTIDDIPKEKLLSKSGKELKGIARTMRIRKILDELNK